MKMAIPPIPLLTSEAVKKLVSFALRPEGWSVEEVLEHHVFEYKQSVASNYYRSVFLRRTVTHYLRVILKLRKLTVLSVVKRTKPIFSELQGMKGRGAERVFVLSTRLVICKVRPIEQVERIIR